MLKPSKVNINKHSKILPCGYTLALVSPTLSVCSQVFFYFYFEDQRECVLSSLTFTPALQALFKVSHLRRYRAVSSDSCSAWQIPCWFHTSDSVYRNKNRHMTSVWEKRIDKLLWFPWGLERTSLCFECLCLMQWRGADELGRRSRAIQEGLRDPTSW